MTMNMTYFEQDGTMRSIGDATTWDDINVSGLGLGTRASAPSIVTVASTNIRAYAFNGNTATVDELHGSLEILHGYKEGSDISAHIHWMPATNTGGDVKWQLEYVWALNDSTISTSTTISATVAAGTTAWKPLIAEFPLITGTGKTIGSRFGFRLFRDPNDAADTYTGNAVLFDFGVHYERDTLGSRGTGTK